MKKLLFAFSVASMLLGTACATNYCERKEKWLAKNCVGGDVTWSPDPTCQASLDNCNEGQLAQANAYVDCLERANVCSLDVMAACQAQHPGGVNLQCQKQM